MSIRAMTWAFSLPLEPRAKLALLAIADNARDDGIAWPSRETIAEKSSQSRSTVGRRIKTLVGLGVIAIFERYREDGTQTTDEIRLDLALTPADVLRKMHDSGEPNEAEDGEESTSHDAAENPPEGGGGGCQADTLGVQSGHPTVAVVTGGGLQSGHPQDEPSLEPSKALPLPPPGVNAPKSDQTQASQEAKPEPEHFAPFFEACQHWRTMDRGRALTAFGFLKPEEQARARAASLLHAEECTRAKRRSKDAHKLLAERFWERYPNARLPEKPPEPLWIEDPDDLAALRLAAAIADRPPQRLVEDPERGQGLWRIVPVGLDLRALATVTSASEDWEIVAADSRPFAAWRARLHDWLGVWIEPQKIWLEAYEAAVHGLPPSHPNFRMRKAVHGLRVPWPWPPKKDGTVYAADPPRDLAGSDEFPDDDASPEAP